MKALVKLQFVVLVLVGCGGGGTSRAGDSNSTVKTASPVHVVVEQPGAGQ